jgi:hypothetical protein
MKRMNMFSSMTRRKKRLRRKMNPQREIPQKILTLLSSEAEEGIGYCQTSVI